MKHSTTTNSNFIGGRPSITTPSDFRVERINVTKGLLHDIEEIARIIEEYGEFLDNSSKESLNKTICDLSNQISKISQQSAIFKVES